MTQRSAHCLDCGEPTPGAYCSRCGQKNADYREGLRELVHDVAQELFQFDSRIAHTIVPFLFQPGKLTVEWTAGKRTRYSSPLRIFLLMSVAYFFALSMSSARQSVHFVVDANTFGIRTSSVGSEVDAQAADAGVDGGAIEDDGEPPDAGANVAAPRSELAEDARSDRYFDFVVSGAPKAMFALLPVFALLLLALFRHARRFYVEHLVFAVHVHAFVFFLSLLGLVLPHAVLVLAPIGVLYLGAALRRFYRPSWLALAGKLFALVFVYCIVLACGLATLLVLAKHLLT